MRKTCSVLVVSLLALILTITAQETHEITSTIKHTSDLLTNLRWIGIVTSPGIVSNVIPGVSKCVSGAIALKDAIVQHITSQEKSNNHREFQQFVDHVNVDHMVDTIDEKEVDLEMYKDAFLARRALWLRIAEIMTKPSPYFGDVDYGKSLRTVSNNVQDFWSRGLEEHLRGDTKVWPIFDGKCGGGEDVKDWQVIFEMDSRFGAILASIELKMRKEDQYTLISNRNPRFNHKLFDWKKVTRKEIIDNALEARWKRMQKTKTQMVQEILGTDMGQALIAAATFSKSAFALPSGHVYESCNFFNEMQNFGDKLLTAGGGLLNTAYRQCHELEDTLREIIAQSGF